jgi:protein phosphatase
VLLLPRGADRVHVAYSGDSRCYHLSRRGLKHLTPDVFERLLVAGTFTEEQARRGRGRFIVQLGIPDVPDDHLVAVRVAAITPGDRFLLCSDGLSGNATDEQLAALLRAEPDAQRCAEALCQLALGQWSRDNVSCVVADVVETG